MASLATANTTPEDTQAHQSGATPSTANGSITRTIQALATHMLPVIQQAVDTNLSSLHRTVEWLVDEAVTKQTGGPVLDTVVLGSMPSSAALHGLSVSATNSNTTSIPGDVHSLVHHNTAKYTHVATAAIHYICFR